jgi:glutamyl-tRNA synthetase
LCEKGDAYYCFCKGASHDERDYAASREDDHAPDHDDDASNETPSDETSPDISCNHAPTREKHHDDPCRALPYAESLKRAEAGEPYVIRLKAPREGATTVRDVVFGDVTTPNDVIEDSVLLKSDGMPTYNFANVVDDHLMGVTHVLRGSEYISSAAKYNLLYNAFGWDIPTYITVSPVMRDERSKLSKRHGDPTYDDLLAEGYLPGAVLNYVALLGWSPGGEREIFSLAELVEVFDVGGISKSPAIFDKGKLDHFNGEYIRALPPADFAGLAEPYVRQAVANAGYDAAAIAALVQQRCAKLADIPAMLDFFDVQPDFSIELYIHKKSKTDLENAPAMLRAAEAALRGIASEEWCAGTIHAALAGTAERLGVKNATVMWPLRIAVTGKAVTPGGAVEICAILGKDETLRRLSSGIEKLGAPHPDP